MRGWRMWTLAVLGCLLASFMSAPAATAAAPAAAPTGLYVTVLGTSTTASWATTADATGYEVLAYAEATGGTGQSACTTSSLTCTFSNLTNPANLFYSVRASNSDGAGPESARIRLCNGSSDLCSRPFNETVFAGTHNAMASDDAWSLVGSLNPITNQTFTIRGQLDRGIRAVNFDVYYGRDVFFDVWNADGPTRSGVEPYLCHTLCTLGATRLEDGFEDIVSFLQANPREVVVVYLEDYISVTDLEAVVQSSGLANYVVNLSGAQFPLTTGLGTLIDAGKRVVIVSQNVSSANATSWLPRFSSIGMDTEYAFDDTSQLTTPGSGLEATCDPTPWGRYGNGRFFLMQHFITDPIASVSDSAVVNTKAVLVQRALACKARRGVLPSILLVDYFEEGAADGGVLGATRALNDLYSPTAPRVTSVSPSSGVAGGGTQVTITGSNFSDATATVTFGSSPATSVSVDSTTTITATTPSGSGGPANVTVTTSAGSMMLWSGFTYGTPDPLTDPDVTGVSPAQGTTAGGTTITVTGTNLGSAEDVLVGGAPASSVAIVNATTVTAVTPEGLAGTVDVAVRTDTGYDTLAQSFTYVEPVQPPSNPSSGSTPTTTTSLAQSPITETEQTTTSAPTLPPRLSPQSLAAMSPLEIAALRPADGALLSVAAIKVLTPQQLAAMQPETVRRLRPQVIAALTPEQMASLKPSAIRLLRPEQAASLAPRQVTELDPMSLRQLSPAALRALPTRTFRALTPRQLEALRPRQVKALDRDLLELLTNRQLKALED